METRVKQQVVNFRDCKPEGLKAASELLRRAMREADDTQANWELAKVLLAFREAIEREQRAQQAEVERAEAQKLADKERARLDAIEAAAHAAMARIRPGMLVRRAPGTPFAHDTSVSRVKRVELGTVTSGYVRRTVAKAYAHLENGDVTDASELEEVAQ